MQIYSKTYLADEDTTWAAIPTNTLLQRIHAIATNTETSRWIGVIRSGGEEHKISLGSPIVSNELALYLPNWFIDPIGINGTGEERIVKFEMSERLPKATSLKFKAIGHIPDWIDLIEILEEPLSQLGVLKRGQLIPVPVIEDAVIVLEECEPNEQFLFMDGSNIALDIQKDEELPVEDSSIDETAPMIQPEPIIETPVIRGNRGFIPFEGKGYVLGGR